MHKSKPLEIDGIFGSQLVDTQGETLSIDGADISELEAGLGKFNDNHGKSFTSIIGRITKAKKIFKAEDCEDDRQRYYWDKIKAPYIYGRGFLYNDEDHGNAKACAAILRNIHKTDSPLKLKMSVEGGVIARGIKDPSFLARTKITSCALTFVPANNATLVEPLNLNKSTFDWQTDLILIKSVLHLAQTNVPSFRHIQRDASATKVQNNLTKLVDLMKELGIEGEITIPSKQAILRKALEQKIQSNLEEIHSQMSAIKSEELEKISIKNGIAAAATGAAMAMAPNAIHQEPKIPVPIVQQVRPSIQDVLSNTSKQYPLLGAIANVESSGGKNLQHKTMTAGVHKGMTAGGPYGMMPHSAAFMLSKDPELAKKYPKLMAAAKDIKNHHKDFTETFNNDPQAAADFAVSFFKRNKGKTKSDQQLAYSWLNGLKGSWDKYKEGGEQAIDSHPYVQGVMKEYDKLKPKQSKALKKAMTAGFGGGGSPTSLSGGGVLQTESLDQGRDKLKYISCDDCGKEQVHSKHQVKCRHCGTSFNFAKLYSAMKSNK